MKKLIMLMWLIAIGQCLSAQINLMGIAREAASGIPLVSATVSLTSDKPDSKPYYTTSDQDGYFYYKNIPDGKYKLQISFIGFETFVKNYDKLPSNGKFGSLYLKEESIELGEVVAQGRATRATQKGDTLSYNASAFKTAQGSTTEDLITKMPGILVEGGKVQAQGEEVKRVFVDGKAFFEGDATLALRTLPADLVESIEVYDRQSDDSQFSGINDGNTQKSINIRTRYPSKVKQFGKVTAGLGTDWRYQFSGNYNYFKDERRISILAMSNNVNQQNFSQEDLAGVMNSGGRSVGKRGNSSTMLGNIAGITNTTAVGINYSDKWGEKVKVQGSYFFNHSDNHLESQTARTYYDTIPYLRRYNEEYSGGSINTNHRFNLKLDYDINDRNAIMFIPNVSFQNNRSNSYKEGVTMRDDEIQNKTFIQNDNITKAVNMSAMLMYRHRFEKAGRMISFSLNGSKMKNDSEVNTSSLTEFLLGDAPNDSINRLKINDKNTYRYGGMANYNEPLSDKTFLNLSYRLNYNKNDADNRSYFKNREVEALKLLMDTAISNVFESDYITQTGTIGIRHFNKDKGLSLYANINFEHAHLKSEQLFPSVLNTDKRFFSILPFARMDYKINQYNSLRMMLRGSSKEPSINDLQNVVNNNNPLFVSGGNPNLKQESSYMLSTHYTLTTKSGISFFTMLGGTYTHNYIGDKIIIATEPTEVAPGIIINDGAQFSSPINFKNSWGANALLTLGLPIDLLRSNLNLTASFRYNNLPSMYNGKMGATDDFGFTPGLVLSSNISEKLDFTLSYFARLNYFESEHSDAFSNSYINQTATAKFEWEFFKGFTFASNFSYENYTGMTDSYNQNFFLLNASLGKRFLRSKRLEVKVTAHDILNQNQSIKRDISNNYYQDVTSNVLKPYAMISFVYDLRLFPGNKGSRDDQKGDPGMFGPGPRPDGPRPDGPRGGGGGGFHGGGPGGFGM